MVQVTTAVLNQESPGSVVPYHRRLRRTLKYVNVVLKMHDEFLDLELLEIYIQ